MNLLWVLLIVLLVLAVGGGYWGPGGAPLYPTRYGYGGGIVLLVILVLLIARVI